MSPSMTSAVLPRTPPTDRHVQVNEEGRFVRPFSCLLAVFPAHGGAAAEQSKIAPRFPFMHDPHEFTKGMTYA